MVGPSTAAGAVIRHFIFGYGSLICPKSRSITAPTLAGVPATPAIVYNLQRTWSARIDGPKYHLEGFTAMGVRFRRGYRCSGVLIEVDEEELAQFDVRETGYDRKLIELEHIHKIPDLGFELEDEDHVVFHKSDLARRRSSSEHVDEDNAKNVDNDDDSDTKTNIELEAAADQDAFLDTTLDVAEDDAVRVWVYLQREHKAANKRFPIHQSYVDMIMRGCLSISEGFARSFLDTTHGWHNNGSGGDICLEEAEDGESREICASDDENTVDDDHHTWVEDRHLPLYVRADPHYSNSFGHKIDELVRDHHPDALEKRRTLSAGESEDKEEG
eukprot:CAMPEP_0197720016 /NCGR_PEP_ID=MMETSP1434-20131217/3524_1 /TAXON_ID=265543 /ORGANISM="Minutocellus polymorphus, Strain CCMP3303" /LENGTH=328 /DNA_ID=CAMNT_0043304813 /DNA_START=27 /DNA_END=1013 /DNA_ORIENTATION=-